MNNPFSMTFGKEPYMLINTYKQFDAIKDMFLSDNPAINTYLITGVRGSGKTVLLTRIEKYFDTLNDWIIIDINPEIEMLEYLASCIYEKCNSKFKFAKKTLSFSFKGLAIELYGEKPVSNVVTLLEELLTIVKKNNKKVLICIDDTYSNKNVKAFVQQFQILLRKEYPIFLLMTGLYENIKNLQNEKTLTFLYRAPSIRVDKLNLISIAESYERELKVKHDDAVNMSKLTNGYAYAYQVLGHLMYEEKKYKIDDDILNKFDTYLREYVYEKIYSDLTDGEKKIINSLAVSKDLSVSEIVNVIGISKGSFSQYRDKLIKKGILDKTGWGKLDFSLPRFKEYVILQKEYED